MIQTVEIRPEQAKAEYIHLLEQQRRQYFDASGMPRPEYAVPSDCPVCGGGKPVPYDPDVQPAYQQCSCCGGVYTHPRLSTEAIADLVRNSPALNFFHEHVLLATEPVRREHLFRRRLHRFRTLTPAGRVLELGCAVGTFLGMLEEAGYDAEGIELCAFSVKHNLALGRRVHDRPIEQLQLPTGSFDAVCAWEVFCHLERPRDTAAAAFNVLRPGGLLMLTTINILSFEYLTLRARHHTMIPLVFYQYFTPDGMRRLLESCGFVEVTVDTPGETDVQAVREALRQPDPALGDFLNRILFDDSPRAHDSRNAFQRFIANHGWSGHMLATARKPS